MRYGDGMIRIFSHPLSPAHHHCYPQAILLPPKGQTKVLIFQQECVS